MSASWGLCWQFPVDKYVSNFNSGRKICRLIWVGRYAGDCRSGKNAGNVGSEQNVDKFGPEKKNAGKFEPKIKMPVFSGGDKITGEFTGLL